MSVPGRRLHGVTIRRPASDAASGFAEAVDRMRDLVLRPEISLSDMPAPKRIAPHSAAFSAEIVLDSDDEPLATGRFIVLHDAQSPAAWEGPWRVVTLSRAQLEPELAGDPLLGEVGWSWLTDALHAGGVAHHALGGTVTRVVSESFAGLADTPPSVEIELRASWTPDGDDLPDHLAIWTDVLSTIAGIPPVPQGVATLAGRLR